MGKINRKMFWMECYLLKWYINCVSPQQKNPPPLLIDTFAPSSYKVKAKTVIKSVEYDEMELIENEKN